MLASLPPAVLKDVEVLRFYGVSRLVDHALVLCLLALRSSQ